MIAITIALALHAPPRAPPLPRSRSAVALMDIQAGLGALSSVVASVDVPPGWNIHLLSAAIANYDA